MKSLIFFLIKEAIPFMISGELIRRNVRRLILMLALYLVISFLGLATIIFLYIFLDRWLTSLFGGEIAAAILCSVNLALIGGILIVRTLTRLRPPPVPKRPFASSLSANPNFNLGIEAGRNIGKIFRRAAPQIAAGAAIVGLVIGAKPLISYILRRRSEQKVDRR